MQSMTIVPIGCADNVLSDLRREALNHSASFDAEFADIQSALKGLDLSSDTMRLFVVQVSSGVELANLKRLSATFIGRPIIALVNADKDSSIVVRAMRAGALQVVLLPFQRADFWAAVDCIAVQFGLAPGLAKTIVVAGAGGGCGTTTIALNLAYELACVKQIKCVLLELSLRMGVLASHLDVQPKYTTSDLLFGENVDSYAINQALTPIVDNLSILPGPYQTIEPGVIKPDDVLSLIEMAEHLAAVVVVDLPCNYDDLYFKVLAAADSVVLVTQQKVSSIRGVQMVCEALPELRPTILVNRYDAKLAGFSADRLRSLLHCPGLATVSYDSVVGAAVDHGRPLRLQASGSRALAEIRELMERLAPQTMPSDGNAQRPTLLGRLSRALTFAKV